jgi:hypothetical protein
MDGPPPNCRSSRRGRLGTYSFANQQPDSAVPGENHGYGRPVAAVAWQRTIQCPRPVHFGAGTLLCGNCRRDPEFLGAAQITADSQQARDGNSNSSQAYCSTPVAAGGCASTSPRTSATTGLYSSPRDSHSDSGRPTPDGNPASKPILVASGTCACEGGVAPSATETTEARKTEAAQRDRLQQRRRTSPLR